MTNFQHYDMKHKGTKTEKNIEMICSTFNFYFH